MNKQYIRELMQDHNTLVKEQYQVSKLEGFGIWLVLNANYEENYIEIGGNETISGHAEILYVNTKELE